MSVQPANPLEHFKAEYMAGYAAPLAECEKRLAKLTGEPGKTLGESCALTLAAGGKRLRPLLVFLSVRKDTALSEELYKAAMAVELVHMATLVHDDVLDGAELRRGQPTLAATYGPLVSTAAGDFLFSSAFEILSAAGSPGAVSMLAEASLELSLGELVQMTQTRDYGLNRDAYEERCRLKTAGLFSTACCLGALLSGCSERTIEAMMEFGRCLGLAFQITDDILDFAGDTSQTGKRAGADLRDGTVTLPLILAMEKDDSLAGLLAAEMNEEKIDRICHRVRDTGALEDAAREAWRYVKQARETLGAASGEIETAPLELIVQMAVDRKV